MKNDKKLRIATAYIHQQLLHTPKLLSKPILQVPSERLVGSWAFVLLDEALEPLDYGGCDYVFAAGLQDPGTSPRVSRLLFMFGCVRI